MLVFFQSLDSIYIKLACAVLAGTVLGLEREYSGHAAGLRTIILVCLMPTLALLACEIVFAHDHEALSRIMQGLFAGVGFIGGGVILKHDKTDTVRGVTTAAVLWMATTLGLIFGFGLYQIGFIGLGLSFFVVYVLSPVARLFHTRRHAVLTITTTPGALTAQMGVEILSKLHLKATIVAFDYNAEASLHTLSFAISYRTRDIIDLPAWVRDAFTPIPGIRQLYWS